MKRIVLALALLASPAWAQEAAPTPTAAAPTPTPAPTTEPRCEDSGPLVRCRAVQDPAAALNARVTTVEQRMQALDQGAAAAIGELRNRVTALEQPKGKKP